MLAGGFAVAAIGRAGVTVIAALALAGTFSLQTSVAHRAGVTVRADGPSQRLVGASRFAVTAVGRTGVPIITADLLAAADAALALVAARARVAVSAGRPSQRLVTASRLCITAVGRAGVAVTAALLSALTRASLACIPAGTSAAIRACAARLGCVDATLAAVAAVGVVVDVVAVGIEL